MRNSRWVYMLSLALGALLVTASVDAQTGGKAGGKTRLNDDDREFINKTAQSGMAELQLAQLAKQKAVNPRVKQFAQMMVSHHSKANRELKQLAQQVGVQPPVQIDKKDADTYRDLRDLSGSEFDEKYIETMIDDHKKDISEFEDQQEQDDTNPALKRWVTKTLPVLQSHLTQAELIKSQLDKK